MNRGVRQDSRRHELHHVAAQAADWLRIIGQPDLQDDERERFLKWAKESPLHVKEFLMAYVTYQKLERWESERDVDIEELISRIQPNVRPIGPHAVLSAETDTPRTRVAGPTAQTRPLRARIVLLAKIAAAVVITAVPLYFWKFYGTYSTSAGEQLRASLGDGSGVYLNARSRVRVSLTANARDVYLEKGQALFEVQHDPKRPFRVHAADAVIQALGTQFDVRLLPNTITIAVVEGSVQVSAQPKEKTDLDNHLPSMALAKLSAGEAVTINNVGQIARPVQIDVETATSWWQQQLVFERTPLAQIASEFNRYNRLQLRVEGDVVGRKRFNGVFGSRKPESFLAHLAKDESLIFERRGEQIVIRARPVDAPGAAAER